MLLQSLFMPKAAPVEQPVAAATPPAAAVPAATPPAATPAAPAQPAASVPVTAPQPVQDASFASKLFSKVGESQNRFLANQQLVGQVSAVLGARISQTFANVMRMLKGEPAGEVTG